MKYDIEVCIYWNKKFMVNQRSTFDRIDLMQNECSACLDILENGFRNVVKVKDEELSNKQWSEMLGIVDIVIVVDGQEMLRTGTSRPNSLKYLPEMIRDISLIMLRSIDNITNDRKQDSNVRFRMVKDNGKFDKDKAFFDGNFTN